MKGTGATESAAILVVDLEPTVLESLADWFRDEGHRVDTAADTHQTLTLLAQNRYDLAFVDINMPRVDGLQLQARMATAAPDLPVVLMTANGSVETAVAALKAGAYDYITKPSDRAELSHLVRRVREHRRLRSENQRLRAHLETALAAEPIVGSSPAMRRVLDLVASVAGTDSTVLIKGESGTGKELVARAIHARSARRYGPMVIVNCGALAEGILESELFGHEKGAFTGAVERHAGRFEAADGGTIFLDEISAVSPRVQVELLRVLEDKVVTRVGGRDPIGVDFRVISATNCDLEEMVEARAFREDLYWRLNVFTIEIPPLRARAEDTLLLAEHFLERFTRAMNQAAMRLSEAARRAIEAYAWPGNVRELQNAIERAVVIGSPPTVEVDDLPLRVTRSARRRGPLSLAEVEREHILTVLESTEWNISRAARVLEIDRGTLYNRLEKYGVKRPAGKPPGSGRSGPSTARRSSR